MTDQIGADGPPTDDDRMRAAIERAAGNPSPAALAVPPSRWSLRSWRVLTGLAILVTLTVVGIRNRIGRGSSIAPSAVTGWRDTVGRTMMIAAVVGVVVLIAAVLRSGTVARWWSSPLRVLTAAQRKQLQEQLDGDAPVDADQLPLTRLMVTDGLRNVPTFWWLLVLTGAFVGGALRSSSAVDWMSAGLMVVLLGQEVSRHRQQRRRWRTYLELHDPRRRATTTS